MSWISKNLTLDLLAIAIDGLTKSFDRIKNEPGSDWPPAEVPADTPAAVEQPAPAPQAPEPAPEAPQEQPAAQNQAQAPEPAAAPQPAVDRRPEAQAHLRDINLAGGMDWITQTLLPSFGVQSLNDITDDQLPALIDQAAAYKVEKGLG